MDGPAVDEQQLQQEQDGQQRLQQELEERRAAMERESYRWRRQCVEDAHRRHREWVQRLEQQQPQQPGPRLVSVSGDMDSLQLGPRRITGKTKQD